MKPEINVNVPNKQIVGNNSTEHLIVLNTWMKIIETKGETGTLQAFDMDMDL